MLGPVPDSVVRQHTAKALVENIHEYGDNSIGECDPTNKHPQLRFKYLSSLVFSRRRLLYRCCRMAEKMFSKCDSTLALSCTTSIKAKTDNVHFHYFTGIMHIFHQLVTKMLEARTIHKKNPRI